MSYDELIEWGEYAAVEPFGEWRADVRMAQWCALYANAHRDPKQRADPWTIQDFMLFDRQGEAVPDDGPTLDPMLAVMIAVEKRKLERQKKNGQ